MKEQMNKALLLDKMQAGYAEMGDVLAQLDEEQLTAPGVNGVWSAKDVIAHLAAWQRRILDGLRNPASVGSSEETDTDESLSGDEQTNRMNEQFYQENRTRPLTEVLADFRDSYQEMVETVQAMPEEMLIGSNTFAWTDGTPLWEYVAGNTYDHYQEHIEPVRALARPQNV